MADIYNYHTNPLRSKVILYNLICWMILLISSCNVDTNPDGMSNANTNTSESFPLVELIQTLEQDIEFIRVTPEYKSDYYNLPYNFFFGLKENKLWLGLYDSDYNSIEEYYSDEEIERNIHVGYGNYGELYDMHLSMVYYENDIKFIETILSYKWMNDYYLRHIAFFIKNQEIVIVHDQLSPKPIYDFDYERWNPRQYGDSYYSRLPITTRSSRLMPWIDNSLLYIYLPDPIVHSAEYQYQYICYLLDDYSIIYTSQLTHQLIRPNLSNAINYEEFIKVNNTTIERINIKTMREKWEFSFIENGLIPDDAKGKYIAITNKSNNLWTIIGEWILYDGSSKKIEITINIESGRIC